MPIRLRPDTLAMTVTLALLTALGPLSTDFYLPSLPDIARVMGSTTAGAQATLSSFLFGFASGQIIYGPLSDRLGRKPVLLAGLALFLAATLACALAADIETLIVARFAQAFGASGPIVLGRAMVRDLYEGPRAGRELARMGMIMGFVPAVAPVIGGVLHQAFGWRSTFLASLGFGLLLSAWIVAALPETLRRRSSEPLSFLSILRGYGTLFASRAYLAYVALVTTAYCGLFAYISGSSFVLGGAYGLSPVQFGMSFAFVVLGYIAGTIVAQRLVGHWGLDGIIRAGTVCLAAGGVAMLVLAAAGTGSSLEITLPMALFAIGVGLVMPQGQAAAMMPFPERAGAASSLLGLCQMLTAAFVGIGVGMALRHTPLAMPITIAVLGLVSMLVFRLSRAARARS